MSRKSLSSTGKNYEGTIGGCPSAVNLNRMLIEFDDADIFYKIVNILLKWEKVLKDIVSIPSIGLRQNVMKLYKEKTIQTLMDLNCPKDIKTHAATTVNTYARKALGLKSKI